MDYKKIHDNIINMGLTRKYDNSKYQNHHIIPLHEDLTSVNVVPLTIKEHRIVHFLRYKLGHGIGNYKAYLLIKGFADVEVHKIIASKGGKIGGKLTKEMKQGIFSENWDRSKETSRRHKEGIIKIDYEFAKRLGKYSRDSKKGIHDGNWDFSNQTKKNWENGIYDDLLILLKSGELGRKYGSIGGITCVMNKLGIHDPEKRSEYASLGGKISGKLPWWTNGVETKKSNHCPGDGWYRGRILNKCNKRGNIL